MIATWKGQGKCVISTSIPDANTPLRLMLYRVLVLALIASASAFKLPISVSRQDVAGAVAGALIAAPLAANAVYDDVRLPATFERLCLALCLWA
jgi:hypothetical protein